MQQKSLKLSPLHIMTPGVVVNIAGSVKYDHGSQQSTFLEDSGERIQDILLASTTQTFRNSGVPYDSDQD